MAGIQINELNLSYTIEDEDLLLTRQGGEDKQISGLNIKSSVIKEITGNNIAGVFSKGCIVYSQKDLVKDPSGSLWKFKGAYPFTVVAGSLPSEPTWEKVTLIVTEHNNTLERNSFGAHDTIYSRVFDCIKDLTSVMDTIINDQTVYVKSFYDGGDYGGGTFKYDSGMNRSLNNGGSILAPDAISTWDGTLSNLSMLTSWTGSGFGCFVRVGVSILTPEMFGLNIKESQPSTQTAISRSEFNHTHKGYINYNIVNREPTIRPKNAGVIHLDNITDNIYVALDTNKFTKVPEFLETRYFYQFDSTNSTRILLDTAFTGNITLRVYPYRNGNQGLPTGSPTLEDRKWAKFTISVNALTEIGRSNSKYFTGVIDFIQLGDSKFDTLNQVSSRLNGVGGTFVANTDSNQFMKFYMKKDGDWVSDDITPEVPYNLGSSWVKTTKHEYKVTNSSEDSDELRLLEDVYSRSRKLELIIELKGLTNGMKLTIQNEASKRVYRSGVYLFDFDGDTLQFSRVTTSLPISGDVIIKSLKIKIGAIDV